jgi:uncharacterized protein YuzE
MRVKYFADTDTALVEFTDNEVAETKEISESIYVDLDRQGNLVNMTIEHARTNARLPEVSYQEVVGQTSGGELAVRADAEERAAQPRSG